MIKTLENIEKYTIYISLFLLPIFFLPVFENVFETPKLLLLFIGVFIVLISKSIKSIVKKGLEFSSSKFDIVVALFGLLYLLSGIIASTNKFGTFFFPGSATFVILGVIYYFFINQLSKKDRQNAIMTVISSAFLMAVLQIMAFLGINRLIPGLPEFMKVDFFTPFGNILNSIVLLIALIPVLIEKVTKNDDVAEKILSMVVTIVFVVSLSMSIYLVLPGKATSPAILDAKNSWSISIDTFKNNPLLGVGPGNYIEAFSKYKPLEFNSTKNWNLKFVQGSSTLMTIFTEVGILAMLVVLSVFVYLIRRIDFKNPVYLSLLILSLGLVFLPLSYSFFPIIFLVLALNSDPSKTEVAFFVKRNAVLIATIPVLLTLLGATYLFARAAYGEILYTRTLTEINKGQGLVAYELINKAVKVNKFSDRYHLLSSGINLAIAENIAKKEKLEDSDKETVSQLIQQSIAEGKATVSVAPNKPANWDALSGIYQSIMAFAKGSDAFAIQTLNQAIALEPTDPLLRIRLGGLYYSLEDYDTAIESYKLAVLSKPDLANAHYNLALAYKANKEIGKAKEQMDVVLKIVDPNSKDYELAKKEADELDASIKKAVVPTEEPQPTETETLTPPPATTPEPEIEPQIELPQQ